MSLESSSNCIAALFEAAATWTNDGAKNQQALGAMALNEVNCATETWSQAKYELGNGESYSEVPTSFQGSWMSKGQMDAMDHSEQVALSKKSASLRAEAYSDVLQMNDGNSTYSGAYHSAEAQLAGVQAAQRYVDGCNQNEALSQAFFSATNALVNGKISAGELSKFSPTYLHHEVTGGATIQQLTAHVQQLLEEKAGGTTVQAAQGVLGQAQAWQEGQTACANAGVKQAQGYLTTATNDVLAGLNAVEGLASMLKLLQRQLAS